MAHAWTPEEARALNGLLISLAFCGRAVYQYRDVLFAPRAVDKKAAVKTIGANGESTRRRDATAAMKATRADRSVASVGVRRVGQEEGEDPVIVSPPAGEATDGDLECLRISSGGMSSWIACVSRHAIEHVRQETRSASLRPRPGLGTRPSRRARPRSRITRRSITRVAIVSIRGARRSHGRRQVSTVCGDLSKFARKEAGCDHACSFDLTCHTAHCPSSLSRVRLSRAARSPPSTLSGRRWTRGAGSSARPQHREIADSWMNVLI